MDLNVEPDELAAAARAVTATANELQSRIGTLTTQVSTLMSTWHGEAARSAEAAWERWRDGAVEVVGGLDAMAGALTNAAAGYVGVDAANASSLNLGGTGA